MHPSFEVPREYAVRLLGALSPEQLELVRRGVELDDGPARVDRIEPAGGAGKNVWYRVTLHEGRNREVRRIFEALGVAVSRLIRVRYGPIALGKLHRGAHRSLTRAELAKLYRSVGLDAPTERTDRR
jgi:23S rRNA pseudouridine2605 synthase